MPSRAKKVDRDVARLPSIPKELAWYIGRYQCGRHPNNPALSRSQGQPGGGHSPHVMKTGSRPKATAVSLYFTACRRVAARSPIFRPYAVPTTVALRKWNPTRMRECPFSSAAWEKLV
jgi:hypothetical protein